ncbi:hypothetical protein L3Y34_005987 [Caenorhabditis briggsae]|uniref:Uncharacterized protein n=1 Tax=Caenorhabditis briggsae TaxID=6238 RepID=A0AAE8ZYF0_CAEBR|nr:hypothetical protein L3Y34_005987 [Caenorhabditis briggsae]
MNNLPSPTTSTRLGPRLRSAFWILEMPVPKFFISSNSSFEFSSRQPDTPRLGTDSNLRVSNFCDKRTYTIYNPHPQHPHIKRESLYCLIFL